MSDAGQEAWRFEYEKLWSRRLDIPINCLLVGKPFLEELSEENDILIGSTAGRVFIVNQTKPVEVLLETKGGAVQALSLRDLTGQGALDLVVGDSDGIVTMFSRQQILSKQDMGTAVTQIDIHKDALNGYEIIAGGMNGTVTSFHPHDILWKLGITDLTAIPNAMTLAQSLKKRRSNHIRCLLSTPLADRFGCNVATLLVCNGSPFIHFIHSGQHTMSLRIPTVVESMAAGSFLSAAGARQFATSPESRRPRKEHEKANKERQVVFAGQDGWVYIMINYEIHQWFKVGVHLSKIIAGRSKQLSKSDPDLVICAGHENCVWVYHDGKLMTQIETSDWPNNITMGDVNADGQDELIVSLLDQTVEVYRWNLIKV